MGLINEEAILLMNRERIERSIERMAYQIAEDNSENSRTLILGLKERGFAVAQLLKQKLSGLMTDEVALHQLQPQANSQPSFDTSAKGSTMDYSYILLVDDVIFSGHTMLSAIQKIYQQYTISLLRTVVLIDRGHRVVPVEASFSGLILPTKLNERVSVKIAENRPDEVFLTDKSS